MTRTGAPARQGFDRRSKRSRFGNMQHVGNDPEPAGVCVSRQTFEHSDLFYRSERAQGRDISRARAGTPEV